MNAGLRYALGCILLAFLYVVTGWLGQKFSLPPGHVTPIWPPSGIAMAWLVIWGRRYWPAVFIAAAIVNIPPLMDDPPALAPGGIWHVLFTGLMICAGSTLQPLAGAWVLDRERRHAGALMDSPAGVVRQLLMAGVGCCLVSCTFGASSLVLGGFMPAAVFGETWLTWWLGDSAGVVLLLPAFVAWSRRTPDGLSHPGILEIGVVAILVAAYAIALYTTTYEVTHVLLGPLVWAAMRYGVRGAATGSILACIFVAGATAIGVGPFSNASHEVNERFLLLQTFMASLAAVSLILATAVESRQRTQAALREANEVLEQRVAERTRDLAVKNEDLGRAMADLKDAQARLLIKERLASLGGVTAGIAHEIMNPLNFIANFASVSKDLATELRDILMPERAKLSEVVADDVEAITGDLTGNLDIIQGHGKRAGAILRQMLEQSKDVAEVRRQADAGRLLRENVRIALGAARTRLGDIPVAVREEIAADLPPVPVFPEVLGRAIAAVADNAYYALVQRAKAAGAPHAPELLLRAHADARMLHLVIRDNGTGMKEEDRARAFEPFYTTKPTGSGTGLGLTTAFDIVVRHHGGDAAIESKEGEYTEVRLSVPLESKGEG